jgi:hypothetical protein
MNFQRWMEGISFAVVTLMTAGLLLGVGWLYKFEKIDKSDTILIYVLGQFITGFWDMVKKRNRIESQPNQQREKATD